MNEESSIKSPFRLCESAGVDNPPRNRACLSGRQAYSAFSKGEDCMIIYQLLPGFADVLDFIQYCNSLLDIQPFYNKFVSDDPKHLAGHIILNAEDKLC